MAVPYCTLIGKIPGGENGRATVRAIPDADGAVAVIDGKKYNLSTVIAFSDKEGNIRLDVIAPGPGVFPSDPWTYTIYVDAPHGDSIKYLLLKQGDTVDIMTALSTNKVSLSLFGGNMITPLPAGSGSPLDKLPLQPGRTVPTVGFFGDSWSTEAMMGAGFNLPAAASRLLGCVPMVSAVDGSGFAHSVSGKDNFEADARINSVCAAIPNLIVTVGSLNSDKVVENGDAEGAAITSAVQTFINKVRAKLPNVPIIMVGPEPSAVSRLLSTAAHVNVKAHKAGVEAAGGVSNGIVFVDWLGVAEKQAVQWRDGRVCTEGDIVVYGGVAYRITRAWIPASGETPLTVGAPAVQVSDVLSGTGNENRKVGDGTRDVLLMSDDTHPTKAGSTAFGSALASRIADAVKTVEDWARAKGAVLPAKTEIAPPTPPAPKGLPIMAWLPNGWGKTDRVAYSLDELKAIAALKPDQIALPIQTTADPNDSAVGIPQNYKTGKEFSNYGLQTIRNDGVNVAGMIEALDTLEAANIAVLPNIRNGLVDNDAQWYRSSDGKLLPILLGRTGKLYFAIHGRGQNKLREIMTKDYTGFKRVSDNTDGAADWQVSAVKNANLGVLPAGIGAESWAAAKGAFPEGVWVLVSSKDDQTTAESAAKAAGVKIVGWAVPNATVLAAIKA